MRFVDGLGYRYVKERGLVRSSQFYKFKSSGGSLSDEFWEEIT